MATVFDRVVAVTVSVLGVKQEEVKLVSSLADDLNADSLDQVQLLMKLEEEFELSISEEESDKIRTVQDAVNYLKEKGVTDS